MCRAGQFDLSYESLTCHEARRILRELPVTEPDLYAEISQPRSRNHTVPVLTPKEATLEDSASDSSADDDSDVPLAEVRAHQETTDTGNPDQVYIANETGGLTSTACAEEVLVESVNGELVDITPLQHQEFL